MKRRSVLAAGVALGTGVFAAPMSAWAAPAPRLSAADVAAARRLFTTGAYTRLGEVLPLLLAAAAHSIEQAPADAARAADVWVLASQLAVKQGRTEPAGAYAEQAGVAARRSGNPVVLAAAARAAATPLRRTDRTDEALHLLEEECWAWGWGRPDSPPPPRATPPPWSWPFRARSSHSSPQPMSSTGSRPHTPAGGTYGLGGHRGDESPLAYDRRGLRVVQVSRRRRRRPPP